MRHLPFQIPQCNLIQKGANLLPISFLSDSYQKKFWFFNAISILNQHTTRAAQPIFNFRAKTATFITGGYGALEMSHSFLSDSYQIPIRSFQIQWGAFLSDSSMQFNSKRCQPASYQIPISSYQKIFWFFNAISILNQHTTRAAQPIFNFRAKTATFITGGLWCTGNVTFLPIRLLSDPYQILSDSMRRLPFRFLNAI